MAKPIELDWEICYTVLASDTCGEFRMRRIVGFIVVVLVSFAGDVRADGILYVDDDAPAGGDGLSWATAFSDLNDALDSARGADSAVAQIRLGGGTYESGPYIVVDGVALVGGYAGLGGPDPDSYDPASFTTTAGATVGGWIVAPNDATHIILNGLIIDGVRSGFITPDVKWFSRICAVAEDRFYLAIERSLFDGQAIHTDHG